MIAETISVGTELLLGQTLDTDAVFIAQMLSRLGISIHFRSTVGDNRERMQKAIRLALSRADLVITIGGLGPTMDDLTKETVAEVLGVEFREDAGHAQWLRELVCAARTGRAGGEFYEAGAGAEAGARTAQPQRHRAGGII